MLRVRVNLAGFQASRDDRLLLGFEVFRNFLWGKEFKCLGGMRKMDAHTTTRLMITIRLLIIFSISLMCSACWSSMDGASSNSLRSFSKFAGVVMKDYSAIVVKSSLTDSDGDGRSLSLLPDNDIFPILKATLKECQRRLFWCGVAHTSCFPVETSSALSSFSLSLYFESASFAT